VGQTYHYEFIVDQSQSSMDAELQVLTQNDSDSSNLGGTIGATLTPSAGVFSNIHIADINVSALSSFSLYVDLSLVGYVDADVDNLVMLMGQGDGVSPPYGSAGPAVAVTGGNFNQTGNQVQGAGQFAYDYSVFGVGSGSDTIDLSGEGPLDADFAGTVLDNGSTVTLSIPLNLFMYLDESNPGLGSLTMSGQLVGTADTIGKQGDADGNGKVDSADLALWQQNYDPLGENANTFAMGDWDGNGLIDSADLALWQQNYDPIGNSMIAVHVPEPGTLLLLTAAGLRLLLKRKRKSPACLGAGRCGNAATP